MGLEWFKDYRDRFAYWAECLKGYKPSKEDTAIEAAFSMLLNPVEEERYYKDQLVACGYMLRATMSHLHVSGVESAAHLERVMLACHLYNAGIQLNLLRPRVRWPDLEYLIEEQGEANIYFGGLPHTLEDYTKRLDLVTGHKPSSDARYDRQRKNARTPQRSDLRTSIRKISYFSLLVQMTDGGSGSELRAKPKDHDYNEPIYVLENIVKHRLIQLSNSALTFMGARRIALRRTLTSLQTLATYRDAMKVDELASRFDIMTFGIICVQVVRIIQAALRDVPTPGWSWMEERNLPLTVQSTLGSLYPDGPVRREYKVDGVTMDTYAFVCEATTKIYFETYLLPIQGIGEGGAPLRFDEDAPSNSDKNT
jgi:hypothetical protein